MFEILSIGYNHEMMAMRDAVLRSKGYVVLEANQIEDGLKIFQGNDVDLAILCHTIPPSKRRKLVAAMKSVRPLTPVLALHQGFDNIEEADLSLDNLSGPEALLECVALLLTKRPERTPQTKISIRSLGK